MPRKRPCCLTANAPLTVLNRTNCYVTFQFNEDEDDIRKRKVVDEYGVEKIYFHESNAIDGDYEFSAKDEFADTDEVADSRSDIEKVLDEFAAVYSDRDARFNHGERHAANLEKQLRELDPTRQPQGGQLLNRKATSAREFCACRR